MTKHKEALTKKREEIVDNIKNNLNPELFKVSAVVDKLDYATDESAKNNINELKNKELARLKNIYRALLKISLGTFGVCDECRDSISDARLEAQPAASLCFSCQEENDSHARRYATVRQTSTFDGESE